MKKLAVLIITLIFVFSLFLFFYFRAHNYTDEYVVDEVKVKEIYNKEDSYYRFIFTYKDKDYELISNKKYTNKRSLVKNIDIVELDDSICLYFNTEHVDLYPICSDNKGYYSPYIDDLSEFKEQDNYDLIKINTLNNKKYLLWNYSKFIFLDSKKSMDIKLFDKDIYNLNLVYQMDEYLLVPDYNENYKFTKLNIINTNNSKTKTMDLRYEVYFDSYFLGHYKDKAYIYDIKNEQELYFDLKKNKIYKSKYQILVNDKWEPISNQKLKNNKMTFSQKELFNYSLENNSLYLNIIDSNKKLKVSNRFISTIVKNDGLDVYYISKDTLYHFNPITKEQALLRYSEWEFNYNNMIFIF